MASHRPYRSRTFFFELILNLVIFTLCAVVSIQVFIEAQAIGTRSTALSHLSIEAQALVETFKVCDGNTEEMLGGLDQSKHYTLLEDGRRGIVGYYDDSFASTQDGTARYRVECVVDESAAIKVLQVTVFDRDAALYTIEAKDYVSSSRRGGA